MPIELEREVPPGGLAAKPRAMAWTGLAGRLAHGAQTRQAALLIALGLLSPASGLLVEMVLAHRYGSSAAVDAYRVCSLAVVFAQQTLMMQLLPNVLVPLFARARAEGAADHAWTVSYALMGAAALAGLALIVLLWKAPGLLAGAMAPGAGEGTRAHLAGLGMHAGAAVLFISVSAAIGGVLQAHRVYHAAQSGQIAGNLALAWLAHAGTPETLGYALSASGLAVLAVHAACLARLRRERPAAGRRQGALPARALAAEVAGLSTSSLAILAAQQLGVWWLNRTLAAGEVGDMANFGYAWKLQIAMALVPFSMATVYFPLLAERQAAGDREGVIAIASRLLRMTLGVGAAATLALFLFRLPVTGLLFGRGAMSPPAVAAVAALFGVLLTGSALSVFQNVAIRICYAVRLPRPALIVAGVNLAGTLLLVEAAHRRAGALGVAWLSAGLSWVAGLGLLLLLARALGTSSWRLLAGRREG